MPLANRVDPWGRRHATERRGLFFGNRGVLRSEGDTERPSMFGFGRKGVRSATGDEQRESVRVSALVIGLGIALLFLGTLADNEKSLI